MNKLHLLVHFIAKEGSESDLEQLLGSLAKVTRTEAGCEQYNLFRSSRAGHFFLDEVWNSQADLDAHMATEAFKAAIGKVMSLLQGEFQVDIVTAI